MVQDFQSPDEINRILSSGVFDELKGALENELFEAKSEPWDFDSDRGKLEFAKDVTALANGRGGVIVVGLSTMESTTYQRNEVQEVHPLPASDRPTDRFFHILQEWLYPVPDGVEFKWYGVLNDPSRGLIGVHVPDQREDQRPFLVAHHLLETGKKREIVFGLVQRLGGTTKPTPVHELHTFLKEGRRLDEIHQKLDAIIAKIEAGGGPTET